jgi:hypothetical protein
MGHWAEVLDVIKAHRTAYVQLLGPIIIELERLAATHDLREAFSCFTGASFAGQPLGRHQARAAAGARPVLADARLRPGLMRSSVPRSPWSARSGPARTSTGPNGSSKRPATAWSSAPSPERAHQTPRVPLGIAGGVLSGPCPCGSPDPRVRLG